eukprot:scaffold26660_cov157-Isochrysis_galbana.AAC.2
MGHGSVLLCCYRRQIPAAGDRAAEQGERPSARARATQIGPVASGSLRSRDVRKVLHMSWARTKTKTDQSAHDPENSLLLLAHHTHHTSADINHAILTTGRRLLKSTEDKSCTPTRRGGGCNGPNSETITLSRRP